MAAHHNSGVRNLKGGTKEVKLSHVWASVPHLRAPVIARLGHLPSLRGFARQSTRGWMGGTPCVAYDIVDTEAPNKKRPKLSRVMGRPNSPPPKSAHMQSTSMPRVCKFHLRAKGMALMGHMPVLARSLWARRWKPSPSIPQWELKSCSALVTPVIGREGIGVDRSSLCTYIPGRGL